METARSLSLPLERTLLWRETPGIPTGLFLCGEVELGAARGLLWPQGNGLSAGQETEASEGGLRKPSYQPRARQPPPDSRGLRRWSQGAGRKKMHGPHRGARFRSAPRRPAGPVPHSLPAQSPSILTPPPVSRRHSPNRNRLLGKGVSGRAQNAKPGNLREPEPSLRHRKTAGQPPRRKGGGARKRSKSRVTDSWDACARLRGLRNRGSV